MSKFGGLFERLKDKIGDKPPNEEAEAAHARMREALFLNLKSKLKKLHMVHSASTAAIRSASESNAFCEALELALSHGVKVPWHKLETSFWPVAAELSRKGVVDTIKKYKYATTDKSKVRSWIRLAINENSMESYVNALSQNQSLIREYFEPWAFMQDDEQRLKLQSLLASVSFTAEFALNVDDQTLTQDPYPINLDLYAQPRASVVVENNSYEQLQRNREAPPPSTDASVDTNPVSRHSEAQSTLGVSSSSSMTTAVNPHVVDVSGVDLEQASSKTVGIETEGQLMPPPQQSSAFPSESSQQTSTGTSSHRLEAQPSSDAATLSTTTSSTTADSKPRDSASQQPQLQPQQYSSNTMRMYVEPIRHHKKKKKKKKKVSKEDPSPVSTKTASLAAKEDAALAGAEDDDDDDVDEAVTPSPALPRQPIDGENVQPVEDADENGNEGADENHMLADDTPTAASDNVDVTQGAPHTSPLHSEESNSTPTREDVPVQRPGDDTPPPDAVVEAEMTGAKASHRVGGPVDDAVLPSDELTQPNAISATLATQQSEIAQESLVSKALIQNGEDSRDSDGNAAHEAGDGDGGDDVDGDPTSVSSDVVHESVDPASEEEIDDDADSANASVAMTEAKQSIESADASTLATTDSKKAAHDDVTDPAEVKNADKEQTSQEATAMMSVAANDEENSEDGSKNEQAVAVNSEKSESTNNGPSDSILPQGQTASRHAEDAASQAPQPSHEGQPTASLPALPELDEIVEDETISSGPVDGIDPRISSTLEAADLLLQETATVSTERNEPADKTTPAITSVNNAASTATPPVQEAPRGFAQLNDDPPELAKALDTLNLDTDDDDVDGDDDDVGVDKSSAREDPTALRSDNGTMGDDLNESTSLFAQMMREEMRSIHSDPSHPYARSADGEQQKTSPSSNDAGIDRVGSELAAPTSRHASSASTSDDVLDAFTGARRKLSFKSSGLPANTPATATPSRNNNGSNNDNNNDSKDSEHVQDVPATTSVSATLSTGSDHDLSGSKPPSSVGSDRGDVEISTNSLKGRARRGSIESFMSVSSIDPTTYSLHTTLASSSALSSSSGSKPLPATPKHLQRYLSPRLGLGSPSPKEAEKSLDKLFGIARNVLDFPEVNGHKFVILAPPPKWEKPCEVCSRPMKVLIMSSRPMECTRCSLRVHKRCHTNVPRLCVSLKHSLTSAVTDICPCKGLCAQNYKCDGCSADIGFHSIFGRPKLCDYSGRYYCSECHTDQKIATPARMVKSWDFSENMVCTLAYDTLRALYERPVLHIPSLNPSLFNHVEEMKDLRKWRFHLVQMSSFIRTCRFAREEAILAPIQQHQHFFDPDAIEWYSMCDLEQVKEGHLVPTLKQVVDSCRKHITSACELCKAQGHVCECCDDKRVIYHFQGGVHKCNGCKRVFHFECFKKARECPVCARLSTRRSRSHASVSEEAHSRG